MTARRIILASASPTRIALLRAAGLAPEVSPSRLDEDSALAALATEGATPRDIADVLAEMKAARVAARDPSAVVIGADQVLDLDGSAWGKPSGHQDLRDRLLRLRGRTHRLHTAVVVVDDGRPVWRHLSEARLTMRAFSEAWLDGYLARNLAALSGAAGGYLIESEGIRLFERIEGDHFAILGLPLLPLLGYLGQRGFIPA